MEKIKLCAVSFSRLTACQYEIVLGRKGKSVTVLLGFRIEDFFHLAGLQKLTDLTQIRDRKHEYVFQDILNGRITDANLATSTRFSEIEHRIDLLAQIEQMLDGDDLYFAYDVNAHPYSKICAKYLVSGSIDGTTAFLFLDENKAGTYFPRSFFPMEQKDYRIGLKKYTLLKKTKINLDTAERELQFRYIPSQKKEGSKAGKI